MGDFLDRLIREISQHRDEQKAIADEHQAITDVARAEQDRADKALEALREVDRPSRPRPRKSR